MTCPCNDTKRKMPRCDAGTPPVLEVSCGETPVLFHTVTIPASVGDVETVPPTPGAYRNTRVFYEVDNVSYLYDSDGIPQLLSGGTTGVMSVNGQTGNVIIPDATTGSNGLMSGADKTLLNTLNSGLVFVKSFDASDITAQTGSLHPTGAIQGEVYKTANGKIGILNLSVLWFDSVPSSGDVIATIKTGLTFASAQQSISIPAGISWDYSGSITTLNLGRWAISDIATDGTITVRSNPNARKSTNYRLFGAGSIILKLD